MKILSLPLTERGSELPSGGALGAQIGANPAGMLRAPARQPGEMVEKNHLFLARNGRAVAGSVFLPAVECSRMAARRAASPRGSSAAGTAGAFQALAAAKPQLLNYERVFFIFFFLISTETL